MRRITKDLVVEPFLTTGRPVPPLSFTATRLAKIWLKDWQTLVIDEANEGGETVDYELTISPASTSARHGERIYLLQIGSKVFSYDLRAVVK